MDGHNEQMQSNMDQEQMMAFLANTKQQQQQVSFDWMKNYKTT